MHFIQFFNETKLGFVLKHLFFIALTGGLLLLLVNAFLYRYTDHGVEVEVPDLQGVYIDEAKTIAESVDLMVVVSDSMHRKDVPAGQILDQVPKVGIHAKRGSTVYVIMNSLCPQMFTIPDVKNMSLRQAKTILQNIGYNVVGTDSVPYAYKGIVVNVTHNGRILTPGERLVESSSLRLQVGTGSMLSTTTTRVPDVLGLTLMDAKDTIEHYHMVLGVYDYDVEPTEENVAQYIVYEQAPKAGKMAQEGESISLLLTYRDSTANHTVEDIDDEFF